MVGIAVGCYVLVSPDGFIEEAWYGAYAGDLKLQVESKFGVRLPGIAGDEPVAEQ